MSMSVESAKQAFSRLINQGAPHQDVIELLLSLRSSAKLSVDDTGWVLWNLCDRYAILRDAGNQYKYQSEFDEWGKTSLSPNRLHWVVTDATQALTLFSGGFSEFWWDCYSFANENSPRLAENRNVRFESHRATASACTRFRDLGRAQAALVNCESVLNEEPGWANRRFAAITLQTLLVDFYVAQDDEKSLHQTVSLLRAGLDEWLAEAPHDTVPSEPLLGSWAQLNADRSPDAAYVAVHNAACAVAGANLFSDAERLFRVVIESGHTMTQYSAALYALSCWENRRNQGEVVGICHKYGLTQFHIEKYAPKLLDLVHWI